MDTRHQTQGKRVTSGVENLLQLSPSPMPPKQQSDTRRWCAASGEERADTREERVHALLHNVFLRCTRRQLCSRHHRALETGNHRRWPDDRQEKPLPKGSPGSEAAPWPRVGWAQAWGGSADAELGLPPPAPRTGQTLVSHRRAADNRGHRVPLGPRVSSPEGVLHAARGYQGHMCDISVIRRAPISHRFA